MVVGTVNDVDDLWLVIAETACIDFAALFCEEMITCDHTEQTLLLSVIARNHCYS